MREDEDLARLVAVGRVHPVDVAGQEQVGDQPLEAVVLGGQEGELFDVGDPVVGPFVQELDRGRIAPLQDGPDRRGGVAFRVGRPELLEIVDEAREEPLALGRQERHRLGCFERLERLAAPGQVLKNRRGLGRTDARQEQEHPPPRGFVARVEHDPQMGEHVLDVGLLEEPQPAADRVGDVACQELALQEDAVVMVAIEHGHLARAPGLFRGLRGSAGR